LSQLHADSATKLLSYRVEASRAGRAVCLICPVLEPQSDASALLAQNLLHLPFISSDELHRLCSVYYQHRCALRIYLSERVHAAMSTLMSLQSIMQPERPDCCADGAMPALTISSESITRTLSIAEVVMAG